MTILTLTTENVKRLIVTATLLAVCAGGVAAADIYRLTVRRIERNLYQDRTSKTIIETRLCIELALNDDAILNWEGRYGNNWLLFVDTGNKCDVVALR